MTEHIRWEDKSRHTPKGPLCDAAPAQSEAEYRASRPVSMLHVIQRGAEAAVAATPTLCGCPDCGKHPAIDRSFYGQIVVYCDNDSCPKTSGDGWPQAMGLTISEAAQKWNALKADAELADAELAGAGSRL